MVELKILIHLDATHDAIETLVVLEKAKRIHCIVKWNPRRNRVFAEGKVSQTRPEEKMGILVTRERKEVAKKTYTLKRVVRVTDHG